MLLAQNTYFPDDNFEQVLINLGYDDVLDDFVLTNNIDSIWELNIYGSYYHSNPDGEINDLTEIGLMIKFKFHLSMEESF